MSRVVVLLVSEMSRELRHCSCFQVAHSPVGEAVLHRSSASRRDREKRRKHLLLPSPITVQAPGRECRFSTWGQDQYLVDSGQALTHICEVNGSIPISHTCCPSSSWLTETLDQGYLTLEVLPSIHPSLKSKNKTQPGNAPYLEPLSCLLRVL